MKVFISWSGDLSKSFAEIFKQWLPCVIQAVKPYYSQSDIDKGARWNTEISKELDESKVGLICLTPDNLTAPWVMFEAGALSKNIDKSKVCPILFDVDPTDIQGPLVQFQAARFNKDEIKQVVKMINKELPSDRIIGDATLDQAFEIWWPQLNEKVESAFKQGKIPSKTSRRSDRDLLEEILNLARINSQSIERQVPRRLQPAAIRDIIHTLEYLINELKLNEAPDIIYKILKDLKMPMKYIISHASAPMQYRQELQMRLDKILSNVDSNKKGLDDLSLLEGERVPDGFDP